MSIETWGSICFGLVVGWVTYRTLRRSTVTGLGDIATVLGVIGGAAIMELFPAGSASFAGYGIGLAVGFFSYLAVSLVIAGRSPGEGHSAVNEWLGEPPTAARVVRDEAPRPPARNQAAGGVPRIPDD